MGEVGDPTAAGAEDAAALPLAPDRALVHGDVLRVGAVDLDVVHLRGHTEGGVALAYADPAGFTHLITGASLFPGRVGIRQRDPALGVPAQVDDVEVLSLIHI